MIAPSFQSFDFCGQHLLDTQCPPVERLEDTIRKSEHCQLHLWGNSTMFYTAGTQVGHCTRIASPPSSEPWFALSDEEVDASGFQYQSRQHHDHDQVIHSAFDTHKMNWFHYVIKFLSVYHVCFKRTCGPNRVQHGCTLISCEDLKVFPGKRLLALAGGNVCSCHDRIRPNNGFAFTSRTRLHCHTLLSQPPI